MLTSCDDADLLEAGYRFGVVEMVRRRAEQAQALGVDGLVASAAEAAGVREAVGRRMILVTPGIRPAGAAVGDQKRVATPASAISRRRGLSRRRPADDRSRRSARSGRRRLSAEIAAAAA